MNRKLAFKLALIATPLVAFFLYAALNWYEVVDKKVRTGMGEEAMRDPYLALSRLLARMGTPVEVTRSPTRLATPPEGGVLVLGKTRLAFMTPTRVGDLAAWVDRGGSLVVEAERMGIDDPLLEHYGLERHIPPEIRDPTSAEARKARKAESDRKQSLDDFTVPVTWPGAERILRVRMTGLGLRFTGDVPEDLVASTIDGKLAVATFPSGLGRVTVLKDFGFLRNQTLIDVDHAEFAWRLASGAPERKKALLFLRAESPSLWEWIREYAWPVLLGAMVLVLFWLARIVPRFGPLEPEPPPVRRSLLEHLRAAGRYTWARGDATPLIDAVRERIWRTALRRRGGLKGLAHSKAHATLAEIAQRPVATVQNAMQGAGGSPAAFVDTASALQDLEAGLAHRPRTTNRSNREKKQ